MRSAAVFHRSQFSSSVQFSSVAQSCLTLCDPMNHSTPGLPVHHQLPEFTQTHAHRVGDAIQPSHPVVPFSSCPQSLPASGSFQMSHLFAWGGQSTGVSASASVLPMNTQDWSLLGWTVWISLQSKGLSAVGNLESENPYVLSVTIMIENGCCCFFFRLCPTLCDPLDSSPPGSSVHGISQAIILEWVTISFSRGSSWPKDQTHDSCVGRRALYCWATGEAQKVLVCAFWGRDQLVQYSG